MSVVNVGELAFAESKPWKLVETSWNLFSIFSAGSFAENKMGSGRVGGIRK